jgi:A/G-specific adenine glycosylase
LWITGRAGTSSHGWRAGRASKPVDAAGRPRTALRKALLAWYRRTARDLPWRRTHDPYRIWLSEILLQQTRVETVVPYYERFVQAFPTIAALARAPLGRVLKLWSGLGYYTRARNLHRAAQVVTDEYDGRFPQTAAEWRQLPGIGRYTAGAIASIANGEPVPAVDGNVQRVLARLLRIERIVEEPAIQAELWQHATALLPRRSPGDFNQALMELGARICTPRQPQCNACPIRRWCAACAAGVQAELPRRKAKRPALRVEATAAVLRRRGRILLVRRPAAGLLGGLWTLPGTEITDGHSATDALRLVVRNTLGIEIAVGEPLGTIQHAFTHRRLRVRVYACRVLRGQPRKSDTVQWVADAQLADFALASVDQKLIRAALRDDGSL